MESDQATPHGSSPKEDDKAIAKETSDLAQPTIMAIPQRKPGDTQPVSPTKSDEETPRVPHLTNTELTPTCRRCSCKNSKCLKSYCRCFANGVYCSGCACDGCQNLPQYVDIVENARRIHDSSPSTGKPKGCKCVKTGCIMNYCICYVSGQMCGLYCRCTDCKNDQTSPDWNLDTPSKRRKLQEVNDTATNKPAGRLSSSGHIMPPPSAPTEPQNPIVGATESVPGVGFRKLLQAQAAKYKKPDTEFRRAFNKTANDNSIRQFIATTLSQLRTLPPEPEMTQLDSGAEPQTVSPTMLDDADPKNQEIIKADPSKIVDCQPVAKSTQDATDFYQPEDTPKSIFQAEESLDFAANETLEDLVLAADVSADAARLRTTPDAKRRTLTPWEQWREAHEEVVLTNLRDLLLDWKGQIDDALASQCSFFKSTKF